MNVTVLRMDDDTGDPISPLVIPGTLTISNVAPTVNAGSGATIFESATFSSTGSISDPDNGAWTGTVNYGDDTAPQALTITGNIFNLSHTYATYGSYTVTVTVNDGDGGVTSAVVNVVVIVGCPTLAGLTASGEDLNRDGRCEDLNGNGVLDFSDVADFFQHFDSSEVRTREELFDFNSNGRIDFDDIIELFLTVP